MMWVEISVYNVGGYNNSPVSLFMILLLQTVSSPGLQILVRAVLGDVVSLVVSVVWTRVRSGVLHTPHLVRQTTFLLYSRPKLKSEELL